MAIAATGNGGLAGIAHHWYSPLPLRLWVAQRVCPLAKCASGKMRQGPLTATLKATHIACFLSGPVARLRRAAATMAALACRGRGRQQHAQLPCMFALMKLPPMQSASIQAPALTSASPAISSSAALHLSAVSRLRM